MMTTAITMDIGLEAGMTITVATIEDDHVVAMDEINTVGHGIVKIRDSIYRSRHMAMDLEPAIMTPGPITSRMMTIIEIDVVIDTTSRVIVSIGEAEMAVNA